MAEWHSWSVAVVLGLLAGACVDSGLSQCADGRVCTAGFVCDDVLGGCVSDDPCKNLAEGEDCHGLGIAGACHGNHCVVPICGDGRVERGEACDDGGALSHDGCSSRCTTETPAWTRQVLASSPSPRSGTAIAYDAHRDRVVLFGGVAAGADFGDTWEWDGTSWTEQFPASSPSPRSSHAMAYDAVRRRIVLFGGASTGVLDGDTWEWDGTSWTHLAPAASPAPRYFHAMTYDAVRGRVVLFGGLTGSTPVSETWEWDGTTWTQQTSATTPPGLYAPKLAYDVVRARVVLVGAILPVTSQTWEWDGVEWSMRAHDIPLTKTQGGLGYDARRRRVVIDAGDGTWEWDGVVWTRAATATVPTDGHGLAYVATTGRIVTFGGMDATGNVDQTWVYRFEDRDVPDESCTSGLDADGDALAGCEDPDCWGSCTPACPPGTSCDPAAPHCGDGACDPDLEAMVCPADCP